MSLHQRIREVIAEACPGKKHGRRQRSRIQEHELSDKANLTDDLNMDDRWKAGLFMAIEEEFNLEIPDEEAEKLLTVGSVVDYVEKRLPSESSLLMWLR